MMHMERRSWHRVCRAYLSVCYAHSLSKYLCTPAWFFPVAARTSLVSRESMGCTSNLPLLWGSRLKAVETRQSWTLSTRLLYLVSFENIRCHNLLIALITYTSTAASGMYTLINITTHYHTNTSLLARIIDLAILTESLLLGDWEPWGMTLNVRWFYVFQSFIAQWIAQLEHVNIQ
jgi:hypothetical protein